MFQWKDTLHEYLAAAIGSVLGAGISIPVCTFIGYIYRTYAHSTKSWRSTVPVDTKWLLKVAAARLWRLPLREATTCLWRFHKLRIWEIFA
jgi:hypothetical protein